MGSRGIKRQIRVWRSHAREAIRQFHRQELDKLIPVYMHDVWEHMAARRPFFECLKRTP